MANKDIVDAVLLLNVRIGGTVDGKDNATFSFRYKYWQGTYGTSGSVPSLSSALVFKTIQLYTFRSRLSILFLTNLVSSKHSFWSSVSGFRNCFFVLASSSDSCEKSGRQ